MKPAVIVLAALLTYCHQTSPDKKQLSVTAAAPKETVGFNYNERKLQCKKLFVAQKRNDDLLVKYITDSLIACWYGTPWDFNGCTTIPQQGKIACGYFVTTVLHDAGLPINRIKMARCASSVLIKTVCTQISSCSNKPIEYFINAIKFKGWGLYITGLDFHTGFIYNDGREVYFIHASFYGTKSVVKEKAIESTVLRNSKLRIIGRINFNN